MTNDKTREQLNAEIQELQVRLEEAEETLQAIREGDVDAVVVRGPVGEQVFTLTGEDTIYRRLVETMNEAGLTVSPEGTVLFCNQRLSLMLGTPMEQIVGRPIRQFLDYSSYSGLSTLLAEVQSQPYSCRLVFHAADGTPVPAWTSASLLIQGDLPNVCLVAADLRKLEATEETVRQIQEHREALRRSEERYRTLFEAMDQGFCIIEMIFDEEERALDYRFLEVNPAFVKQTGLVDAAGKRIRELVPGHEDYWFETFGHIARTGKPLRFINVAKKLGRWYDVYAFKIGRPEEDHVAVFFTDISERKRSEISLKELTENLEERVSERTIQLRALAMQLSQAEQQERKRLARVLHDHLQQLIVAARMQIGMMKNVTDHRKMQSATRQVDEILQEAIDASRNLAIDLSPPVLHEAGLIGGLKWLAAEMEKKHQFRIDLHLETKAEPSFEGVRILLFESVRELLLNAVKHSGAGGAQLSLMQQPGDRISLIVSDKGKGFDPEVLKRRQANDGSFGLFSIQERLVHIGAQMVIESAPDKGTRVTLTVPDGGAVEEIKKISQVRKELKETVTIRHKSNLCSVLIVDDHEIMRQGLVRMFRSEPNIEVIGEASSGPEAITKAVQLRPDVIVMDVNLGEMSGIEATRQILQHHPDIRVVGLSMHAHSDVAQTMLDAGACAYLTKSGSSEELIRAVQECMQPR
jgi:PAS domain S-box-containing protein